ncbi:hypothetical protein DFH09DRAFT_124721 [Mycena vulgaris]|nr:hypothetical protein DFH09DRAFT_124721 [Mycena vulgaris]
MDSLNFVLPLALIVLVSYRLHRADTVQADTVQAPTQVPVDRELPKLRRSGSSVMLCRHCGDKPGTLVCTGCKATAYCSGECQSVSWKQGHKELCQGRTTNKAFTPIAPLDPPIIRMSPAKEREARRKKSWGLACQCVFVIDNRYIASKDPDLYFAVQNPPVLELVRENLHLSDKCAPLDFPHAENEILCEFSILTGMGAVRYKAVVPTPPDFLAANQRSCDIGPPYRVSEELCNRTALGLQNSFAEQLFAMPQMWKCANTKCLTTVFLGIDSYYGRKVVIGSKLVFRTRKPALEDMWAPCCYDEGCITTIQTMLANAMTKQTKK